MPALGRPGTKRVDTAKRRRARESSQMMAIGIAAARLISALINFDESLRHDTRGNLSPGAF